MSTISDDKRAAALSSVRIFCAKPWREHGKKATSGRFTGWYTHDWNRLVFRIHVLYYGTEPSIAEAQRIGNLIRKSYRGGPNWNHDVNVAGAHENILRIIEEAFRCPEVRAEKPQGANAFALTEPPHSLITPSLLSGSPTKPDQRCRDIIRHFATLKPMKAFWEYLLSDPQISPFGCLIDALELHCTGLVREQAIFSTVVALRKRFREYVTSDVAWRNKVWTDDTLDSIADLVKSTFDRTIANPPSPLPPEPSHESANDRRPQDSGFVPWRPLSNAPVGSSQPGVYLIAFFGGEPESIVDPMSRNVIYVGIAERQATFHRLEAFKTTAFGGIGHSGGWTYRTSFFPDKVGDDIQLLKRFHNTYCSWRDIPMTASVTPRDIERQLLREHRRLFGRWPMLNRTG